MYEVYWNICFNLKNESKVDGQVRKVSELLGCSINDFEVNKVTKIPNCYSSKFIIPCISTSKNDAIVETIDLASKLGTGWYILPIQTNGESLFFDGDRNNEQSGFKLASIIWVNFTLRNK